MIGAAFRRPVVVFVGLGFPRQLNTAIDALQALDDLPSSYRGPAYETAVKACRAAIAGEVEPETARGIVEAYMRARSLLVEEFLAPSAMAARHDLMVA